MKGLKQIPQLTELAHAYDLLQYRSDQVTIKDLVLWSQWARFDPRLAEILVVWISKNWMITSPIEFNQLLRQQPWPAVFAVLIEFSFFLIQNQEDRDLFKKWKKCVLDRIQPESPQQFYIGVHPVASRSQFENARKSLFPFLNWGYLCSYPIFPKELRWRGKVTLHSRQTRQLVLRQLMRQQSRLTVRDYENALDQWITRRQAQRDLSDLRTASKKGNTKGAYYIKQRRSV